MRGKEERSQKKCQPLRHIAAMDRRAGRERVGRLTNLDVVVGPGGDSGDLLLSEGDGVDEVVVYHGRGL